MGYKLTHRVRGKVVLTDLGLILSNYANRMFSVYDELLKRISPATEFANNKFRIGACEYLGARFCFDLISLIAKPHISLAGQVSIDFAPPEKLMHGVGQDLYDLIIVSIGIEKVEASTKVTQSFEFPVRLFAPLSLMSGMEKKEKTQIGEDFDLLIELANKKKISIVLPAKNSVLRQEIDQFFTHLKVVPERTIECNSSSAIIQLIERGFAMGFVPTPCLLDFKSAKFLNILGPPGGMWNHKVSIVASRSKLGDLTKVSPLDEIFSSREENNSLRELLDF